LSNDDAERLGNERRGLVKSPEDLAAGLFLLVFAVVLFAGSWDLKFGQLRSIGAGLMPKVTSFLLGMFGLYLVIQSFLVHGSALTRWSIRGPFFVLGSILLFALTIRGVDFGKVSFPALGLDLGAIKLPALGLVVAGPLAVFVSAMADPQTRVHEALIYAVVLTAFCIGLFKFALRLPIPLAPWLLGY
jgi:Tripartite tricarboxylate transporter TctB family